MPEKKLVGSGLKSQRNLYFIYTIREFADNELIKDKIWKLIGLKEPLFLSANYAPKTRRLQETATKRTLLRRASLLARPWDICTLIRFYEIFA